MLRKLMLIVVASIILVSCTQQRDIFDPETAKTFKNKDIESPFFGDPKSKVQLLIFGDFQCPACIRFEKEIGKKLLNDYGLTNKIGITYKNFPLDIHINAPEDALAAMCAHEQNKYEDFSIKMYAFEEKNNGLILTIEDRQSVAKDSGLDINNFNQCVTEGRYVNRILKDMEEGNKMGLQGTPSIYANGTLLNYDSPENFFKMINELLK